MTTPAITTQDYAAFPGVGDFDPNGDGTTPNDGWYTISSPTSTITTGGGPNPNNHQLHTTTTTTPDNVVTLGLGDAYRTDPNANVATSTHVVTTQTDLSPAHPVYATTTMLEVNMTVNDGAQSTANGSDVNNPLRGADNWKEAASVDGSAGSLAALVSKDYVFTLSDDVVLANGKTVVNDTWHGIVDTSSPTGFDWKLVSGSGAGNIVDNTGLGPLHKATFEDNSENSPAFFDPGHNFGARHETVTESVALPGSAVPLIAVQLNINHVDHAMI